MSFNARWILLVVFAGLITLGVSGCTEEKTARLEIEDYELSVRAEGGDSNIHSIDAKGTVANKGDVDVKNVEITGYCTSCEEEVINGQWFVSDYEKTSDQKDVIGYLPAGATEEFEFQDIAFFPAPEGISAPEEVPEDHDFEIVIESHEIDD
ncbi:MAG: hypothetical protein ACQETG_08500 [Thermodesulfobacteriota bacterium]